MSFKFRCHLVMMIILVTNVMQSSSNFFLSIPSSVSLIQLTEQIKSKSFSMTWCHPLGVEKSIEYHAGKLTLIVAYTQLPQLLTEDEKKLFISTNDQKHCYAFKEDGFVDPSAQSATMSEENSVNAYYLEKPRIIKKETNSKEFSCEQLADILATKRSVFYTGAGVSMAKDVWGMPQLMQELGLSETEFVDDFVVHALRCPEILVQKARSFFHSMLEQEPTLAHKALSVLAARFSCQVITENLDMLHERTGISPLRVRVADFIQRTADIKDVEIVICCGLSHDDRGFLAWYKKHNPQGIIIALDIKKPRYIDQEDGILFGDIQEVLPQLVQLLEKREKNNGNTKK